MISLECIPLNLCLFQTISTWYNKPVLNTFGVVIKVAESHKWLKQVVILIFMSFIILWNSFLLKNTCIALLFIRTPSVPVSLHLHPKANSISGTLFIYSNFNARASTIFTHVRIKQKKKQNERFIMVVNVLKMDCSSTENGDGGVHCCFCD